MRMPSNLSNSIRVAPQQERSSRRLASFLDAAAELFVEVGYEATTMTAIAERSGSSIGALYNYFPDKQAVALTLLGQYAQEMEEQWRPLIEQAPPARSRSVSSLASPRTPGAKSGPYVLRKFFINVSPRLHPRLASVIALRVSSRPA